MVAEAEKFRAEDDANRSKVEAKNQFEGYVFNIRNTIDDESISSKLDASDKSKIEQAINDATQWLDTHHGEILSKEEYDLKQKDIEKIVNPIITKMYQSAGGAEGGFPGTGAQGSTGASGFPGAGGFPGTGFPGSTGAHHGASAHGNEPSVEEVD